MAAPNKSTWDLTPPRRPTSSDFNGAALQDDPVYPPDPGTMPTAALINTTSLVTSAVSQVTASAIVSVTNNGTAALSTFASAASAVIASTFTVTRNSVGNVSVTWPANTFPSPMSPPMAGLNSTSAGTICSQNITNGVQVFTFASNGTATDFNFTVLVP